MMREGHGHVVVKAEANRDARRLLRKPLFSAFSISLLKRWLMRPITSHRLGFKVAPHGLKPRRSLLEGAAISQPFSLGTSLRSCDPLRIHFNLHRNNTWGHQALTRWNDVPRCLDRASLDIDSVIAASQSN
ncbi:unnamed protein product [Periconia digitata]|uniref:Uncharacterized protein n=1 Tax=Periconia digitata TaxID=1303443 RepID=A0A9W4XEN4_9PLEO|nr:unnamed protein product [Periconia digitata]